jgi:beta-phosphoglucomutase-like phosphatase (HAD superfamily)
VGQGRERRLDEAAPRILEASQIGSASHDSMSFVTTRRLAAILDVDGTLVDSNYHHALAWYRAFREHDIVVPLWRLHRHVGMGGEKYVAAVAGDVVERELGDELRARWEGLFDQLLPEIQPLDGAYELMAQLKDLGHPIILASSAIESHFEAFVDDKLDARELADAWTTKDDVEASKPDPDLVRAALSKARTANAIMIGDTPLGLRSSTPRRHRNDLRAHGWVFGVRASGGRRRCGLRLAANPSRTTRRDAVRDTRRVSH